MSIGFQIAGLDQAIIKVQAWLPAKEMQIDNRVQLAGINTQRQAKKDCPVGTPESTHKKKYHGGRLRQSIQYVPGKMKCSVGSDVYYAVFVDRGTRKMRARPFLTNAYLAEKSALQKDLEDMAKS